MSLLDIECNSFVQTFAPYKAKRVCFFGYRFLTEVTLRVLRSSQTRRAPLLKNWRQGTWARPSLPNLFGNSLLKLVQINFNQFRVSSHVVRIGPVLTKFKKGKRHGLDTKPSQFPFQTGYRTFDLARYNPRAQNSTYQIVSSPLVCFSTFSMKKLFCLA